MSSQRKPPKQSSESISTSEGDVAINATHGELVLESAITADTGDVEIAAVSGAEGEALQIVAPITAGGDVEIATTEAGITVAETLDADQQPVPAITAGGEATITAPLEVKQRFCAQLERVKAGC